MICDVEDVRRLIKDALDHHDRIHDGFSETQMIVLEEIIREVVREMDAQGFFSHDHKDGEVVEHYVPRDEEDAQRG